MTKRKYVIFMLGTAGSGKTVLTKTLFDWFDQKSKGSPLKTKIRYSSRQLHILSSCWNNHNQCTARRRSLTPIFSNRRSFPVSNLPVDLVRLEPQRERDLIILCEWKKFLSGLLLLPNRLLQLCDRKPAWRRILQTQKFSSEIRYRGPGCYRKKQDSL